MTAMTKEQITISIDCLPWQTERALRRREGSGKQGKIWPGDGKLLPQPWLKPTGTPSQPLPEISISGGRTRAEARSPIAADAFTDARALVCCATTRVRTARQSG